jgi:hypothetical protein
VSVGLTLLKDERRTTPFANKTYSVKVLENVTPHDRYNGPHSAAFT